MKARLGALILIAAVAVACGGPIASLLPSNLPLPTQLPVIPSGEPTDEPSGEPTEKPSKEPTEEPSAGPTEEPSSEPTAEPTGSPGPTASAGPTASPTATPIITWTEPTLVADGRYAEPDVIVDDEGAVHVAAAGTGNNNRGIWYMTNAGGQWTTEQVSTPPPSGGEEYDGEPSIAIDDDGSVWIAFTRWLCGFCAPNPSDGIFGVTNVSGDWSDAVQLAGEQTNSPSLVIRGGTWYFAHAEGMLPGLRNYPVWFAACCGELDYLTIERVDRNGGLPTLDIQGSPQGSIPRVLYSGERVSFAIGQADGSFVTQPLPGSNDGFDAVLGVQRGTGEAVAAWSAFDVTAEHLNSFYAQRVGDTWNSPTLAVEDVEAIDLGYARSGAVHMLGAGTAEATFDTLFYAFSLSPSGQFTSDILSDIGGSDAALSLDDATGQPHVVYATDADGDSAIWYLVGPAV